MPQELKSITVFCGSARGTREEYRLAAFSLGELLASSGIRLVYGGASIGLMGAVADGALARGGEVLGVIPNRLSVKEITHAGLSELIITETMHERKAIMADACDGFIALPGGWGTFDELFEILTWAQLAIHAKPVGILNVLDYFEPLFGLLDHARAEGFVSPQHSGVLISETDPEVLLAKMRAYESPVDPQWAIDPSIR